MRRMIVREALAVFTALCCVVLFMPAPARAQSGTTFTYYLQIPGIPGEGGKEKGVPTGAIEVLGFSFGASNTIELSSTSKQWSAGKASFSDLSISVVSSRASPPMFFHVAAGTQFNSITLTGVGDMSDGRKITATYTMRNVFITSYQAGNSSGGVPTDLVSFKFGSLTYDYVAFNPLTGITVRSTTCWNMETNNGSPTSGC